MKSLTFLPVIAALVWLGGCNGDVNSSSPSAPIEAGTISGTVRLAPNASGTVDGTIVYIYTSREDAMLMRPTVNTVADQWGDFSFAAVYPGKYYIGLWKDNDFDGVLDSGDFGTDRSNHENCCCNVNSGCNTAIYPYVYVIP